MRGSSKSSINHVSQFRHHAYQAACLALMSLFLLLGLTPVASARLSAENHSQASPPLDSPCVTAKGESGTISVCIDTPQGNSTVSGNVPIGVTLTGPVPDLRRAKLIFLLNNQYVLTDYIDPYRFLLPSDHFPNGLQTLSVITELNNGTETSAATINIDIENDHRRVVDQPFAPYAASSPPSGAPLVVAATGDGASGESPAVPDLIVSWNPDMFLYLGDIYENGTYTEFYNWYGSGEDYFSRMRSITNPTVGNHEYNHGEAPGYFEYWSNPPDYYSFDSAGWHFISLDSNFTRQVGPGTPQYTWLAQDLAQNTAQCTLAFFHHPRFSIGHEGAAPRMDAIWALLVDESVDIVLTGHDHNYQRWEPLDGAGAPDPNGITEFVVGSGGHGVRPFAETDPRVVTGVDDVNDTLGALRLELYDDRASFEYINVDGVVLDSGEIPCHNTTSQFRYSVPRWSTANVRSCPSTNCHRITSLPPSTVVSVLNQVTGQVVLGSNLWFEVSIGNIHGYMHSSVLVREDK